MTDAASKGMSGRPAWHLPLLRYDEYANETLALVRLTMSGLSRIVWWPGFLKEAFYEPAESEDLIRAEREASLAKSEVENDFPLVHAHALLGMWSALEALVEDVAAGWLATHPETLERPEFSKIRVPFLEFRKMTPEEQTAYLISEVQRDVRLSQGVTRYERLLDLLGLDGTVPDDLRRALFEAQQVRNVLAHRAGLADRRLVEGCPWLKLSAGQRVTVSHRGFLYYLFATRMYAVEILNRCRIQEGRGSAAGSGMPPLSSFIDEDPAPTQSVPDTSNVPDQAV